MGAPIPQHRQIRMSVTSSFNAPVQSRSATKGRASCTSISCMGAVRTRYAGFRSLCTLPPHLPSSTDMALTSPRVGATLHAIYWRYCMVRSCGRQCAPSSYQRRLRPPLCRHGRDPAPTGAPSPHWHSSRVDSARRERRRNQKDTNSFYTFLSSWPLDSEHSSERGSRYQMGTVEVVDTERR